jgi:hypothetical protein
LEAAEQSRAAPSQVPAVQASAVVQKSPSSQGVPFDTGRGSQESVASLQMPVLQASPAEEQSRAGPLVQVPAVQVSAAVQKSPSSQGVPSTTGWASQLSTKSLQTPRLHTSDSALQSRAGPVHVPAAQASDRVQ